jgi:hypothetical protein
LFMDIFLFLHRSLSQIFRQFGQDLSASTCMQVPLQGYPSLFERGKVRITPSPQLSCRWGVWGGQKAHKAIIKLHIDELYVFQQPIAQLCFLLCIYVSHICKLAKDCVCMCVCSDILFHCLITVIFYDLRKVQCIDSNQILVARMLSGTN